MTERMPQLIYDEYSYSTLRRHRRRDVRANHLPRWVRHWRRWFKAGRFAIVTINGRQYVTFVLTT